MLFIFLIQFYTATLYINLLSVPIRTGVFCIWLLFSSLGHRKEAGIPDVCGEFLIRQIYADDITYRLIGAAETVLGMLSRDKGTSDSIQLHFIR